MRKYAQGFTILEVIIAMVLVAGIAMIMLPSIVADNEKSVLTTSYKKFYTELNLVQRAVPTMRAKGEIDEANDGSAGFLEQAIRKKMKTVPEARAKRMLPFRPLAIEFTTGGGYTAPSAKVTEGTGVDQDRTIVLKNGIILGIGRTASGVDYVAVDINGKKGPNFVGKDRFYFTFDKDTSGNAMVESLRPLSYEKDKACCPSNKNDKTCSDWLGCGDRILNDGMITYY